MSSQEITNLLAHGVRHSGIAHVLRTVRRHLGMDVAFVSHFRKNDRVLEHVDGEGVLPIHQGDAIPLEDGYCLKIVRGELPELIPDTSAVPAAMEIPATRAIPVGAHLSVPIRLASGEIYGTLCCFSRLPNSTLGERDHRLMLAIGDVLAHRIDENLMVTRLVLEAAAEIRRIMAQGAPRIVYQPIFSLASGTIVGVEALSRFDVDPRRTPDVWFRTAHDAGVGLDLELRAIENALGALDHLPGTISLSLNASPELVISRKLEAALEPRDGSRIVLEITEHAAVSDYEALLQALLPLRARGAKLAIDDAGAGYASMRHILNLKADVIKLDMSLTRGIDVDTSRRAFAKGLIAFAHEIGSTITAEGVESASEYDALRAIHVDKAQGYLLGRPRALDELLEDAVAVAG